MRVVQAERTSRWGCALVILAFLSATGLGGDSNTKVPDQEVSSECNKDEYCSEETDQLARDLEIIRSSRSQAFEAVADFLVVGIVLIISIAIVVGFVTYYSPNKIYECRPFDPEKDRSEGRKQQVKEQRARKGR